jgi:gamma-glutamylcyclotransferase (GGCT)/AIG2-like uncharacterized protein YtfP
MAVSGSIMKALGLSRRVWRKESMANKLYIAYGSNLNRQQMAERCPTAKVVGAATLKGYKLLFRGQRGHAVADIAPEASRSVPVLVWSITPTDEAALDRYEGFPCLYRKVEMKIKLGEKRVAVFVYIMNGSKPLAAPGCYYYNTILQGYNAAGFDVDVLRKAVSESVEEENA